MIRYEPGTLVKINTLKTSSTDGFSIARAVPDDCITVPEIIDLETFPSHNDFHGKQILCYPEQAATVMSFLGRPLKISKSERWQEYDVYEILVNKSICQIFAANLVLLHNDQVSIESVEEVK